MGIGMCVGNEGITFLSWQLRLYLTLVEVNEYTSLDHTVPQKNTEGLGRKLSH